MFIFLFMIDAPSLMIVIEMAFFIHMFSVNIRVGFPQSFNLCEFLFFWIDFVMKYDNFLNGPTCVILKRKSHDIVH